MTFTISKPMNSTQYIVKVEDLGECSLLSHTHTQTQTHTIGYYPTTQNERVLRI